MIVAATSAVLGAVFLLSGVLKVSAPLQWRAQSAGLGVARPVAAAIPFVEVVVGALLVTQVARRVVALVAAALLVSFTTLLVLRMAQGRRPPCACFGAWTAKPIGWRNVVRNAVLLGLAAAVAVLAG
ncbi:MAG: MauE/DoxX family redox-associated membrane protein [Ilumatobacteraceae bacterium]